MGSVGLSRYNMSITITLKLKVKRDKTSFIVINSLQIYVYVEQLKYKWM